MLFFEYLLIFFFGLLVGNFATSAYFRIPRDIVIYGFNKEHTRPPHCSSCGHELKIYEYLPIIGAITTRFKCNYCRQQISYKYFIIELLAAFSALSCFYFFSDEFDVFIIIFSLTISLLLSAMLFLERSKMYIPMTASIVFEGIVYRTLIDQTITYWMINLSLATIVSTWLLKSDGFLSNRRRCLVHMILALSVWL